MKAHGFTLCRCKDCLAQFDEERLESFTDVRGLYHLNNCNHITKVDFDKEEYEDDVWCNVDHVYYTRTVTAWEGYLCNCEELLKEMEEGEQE